jgi:hypothetical protein
LKKSTVSTETFTNIHAETDKGLLHLPPLPLAYTAPMPKGKSSRCQIVPPWGKFHSTTEKVPFHHDGTKLSPCRNNIAPAIAGTHHPDNRLWAQPAGYVPNILTFAHVIFFVHAAF